MAESITSPDFCVDLSGYYPVHDYIPGLQTNIGILLLVAGLLNVFMSLVTVLWIKRQKYLAQEETDNDEAVNSVIFPVFVRLLWLSVTVNIISGILVILIPLHRAGDNTLSSSILYGFVWAMQHGVLEGVAFLLMQKGCGQHAARRTRKWSFLWVLLVFILMFASFYYGGIVTAILSIVRDSVLVLFYLALFVAPQEQLFRRPAALFYSKCWLIYRGFFLFLYFILAITHTEYLGNCGYIILSLFIFAIIQPLIMYKTLLLDSWWWQGVDITTTSNNQIAHTAATNSEYDIRYPLMGAEYSLQSAQALANTVDNMRVKGNVTMLNFACIKLDMNKTLGAGSFSKVYKGTYRGKNCAIKLIYTVDITAETIRKVAAEASILSSIRHRNIVSILGVSVLPPSVCLILELCSFGSLSDIIRGYGFDWNSANHRAPLQLAYADVLYLALGCARGLAAVHAYDASLCHRDIKSFNFLVDHQFNVKIADLELGMMAGEEGLSTYEVSWRDPYAMDYTADPYSSNASASGGYTAPGLNPMQGSECDSLLNETHGYSAARLSEGSITARRHDPECVNVNEMLANWLAPEVILERKFQQASDVYALGTVFWEILSGKLPFDSETPVIIRRKIVSGYTHPLPIQYCGTQLGQVVSSCWSFDPAFRPSSHELVRILERMLGEQSQIIRNVDPIPDTAVLRNFYDLHYRKSVYGDSTLHKYLFADLERPSLLQYANPINWIRYWYNLYSQPVQYTNYRPLSIDDYRHSSMEESSLSDSGADSSASDPHRESLPRQQLFDPEEDDSETGMLSRSSYVLSDDQGLAQAMSAQLPRAALDVIGVIKEEAYWSALERSGEAWAVTTIDAPYIVMHATAAWYRLFNIRHSLGSYHHMYSIMSLIGRDSTVENNPATVSSMNALNTTSYTSSNAYVQDWKETTVSKTGIKTKSTHHLATNALLTEMHEGYRTNVYKQVHGVLCFSLANKHKELSRGSRASFSTHSSAPALPQGHNLMCTLHIYPIFASGSEETQNHATEVKSPLSSSTLSAHRPLSPLREYTASSLTSSLAGVTAPIGVKTSISGCETPPLRRSATQTPHDTSSSSTLLRRSNTQVSHTSFASSIRTSTRLTAVDTPRPVYYAIQFHELVENIPEVVGAGGVLPNSNAATSNNSSGCNAQQQQQQEQGISTPHSPGGADSTSNNNIFSSFISGKIGKFWSLHRQSGTGSNNNSSKNEKYQNNNSNTTMYRGSFGRATSATINPDTFISNTSGRIDRHSVS